MLVVTSQSRDVRPRITHRGSRTHYTGHFEYPNKTLYFLLSKRVPVRELVEHARDFPAPQRTDVFLSALLHVARLMPEQADLLASGDEETRDFVARLEESWRALRPYFADRYLPPTKRWFAGMRPAGFPTRRLAAVAVLLARLTDRENPLFVTLRNEVAAAPSPSAKAKEWNAFWKKLAALIEVSGDEHYFGTHFSFGGKKQSPQALLGMPAAMSLLFNVFLPLVVLYAREKREGVLEKQAWALLMRFPALESNSVVKFMERRLFGDSAGGIDPSLFKREVFQQALLKIFADCCAQNERTCDDCTLFALAEKIRASGGGEV